MDRIKVKLYPVLFAVVGVIAALPAGWSRR